MGEEDTRRQALNVARMKLLGAEVVPVTNGSRTLKDAINEAMRDWVTNVDTTHYLLGTVAGPHPFPTMVREFHRVIGDEARGAGAGPHRAAARRRHAPVWAAAPTPSGSSAPSWTTRASRCTASRQAARAWRPGGTRPASAGVRRGAARHAFVPAAGRRWGRPWRATRSQPGWTTPASARSTRGCTTPVEREYCRSPTPRRWTPSRCCAGPRGSSPRSSRRTPWPVRWRVGRELGPDARRAGQPVRSR